MANTIISQRPANREWLTRDWSRYTLTTYENDRMVSFEPMTEKEARAYVEEHPDGRTIGIDEVDFDSPLGQFTYQVEVAK